MTDISVTAANVRKGANAKIEHGLAAAAILAGQVVYKDPATGKFGLCDCDSATDAVRWPYGIAVSSAPGADQDVAIQTEGDINPGGTAVRGQIYVASGNAGGIAPVADLASGDYVSVLGIGTSASNIMLRLTNSLVIL